MKYKILKTIEILLTTKIHGEKAQWDHKKVYIKAVWRGQAIRSYWLR